MRETRTQFFNCPKANRVAIIGCGGTGSLLAPMVARDIVRMETMGSILVFVDPDIVEEKNLVRQNFVRGDLGKYKAQVLAERYSRIFGIRTVYLSKKFDDFVRAEFLSCGVILGCVDNLQTRREMLSASKTYEKEYLDVGNEREAGQAVIGYSRYLSFCPMEILYPDVLTQDKQTSCADAPANAQNLPINILSATFLFTLLSLAREKVEEKDTIVAINYNVFGRTSVVTYAELINIVKGKEETIERR